MGDYYYWTNALHHVQATQKQHHGQALYVIAQVSALLSHLPTLHITHMDVDKHTLTITMHRSRQDTWQQLTQRLGKQVFPWRLLPDGDDASLMVTL